MRIPFYKPSIGPEEINEVIDTLKSGWLTTGPKVKQFEQEFARYLGHARAVAVNSCTAALHLALDAVGVKEGDTVVVPTMTFAATAEVVRYFNAHPLLVDCRKEDFNLDTADADLRIRSALERGQRVVALMPMHYGGQIGDVAGARELAQRYQLKIVEDAAHCCPAYYREEGTTGPRHQGTVRPGARGEEQSAESFPGARCPVPASSSSTLASSPFPLTPFPLTPTDGWRTVGSSADISCYSFYANKTITTGEGGMACTQNEAYEHRMRIMSLHGLSRDAWKRFADGGSWYYEIIAPGFKYNLTDIAAAIGLHQVRKAAAFHARRTALAACYAQYLQEVDELILPSVQPNRIHSWHLYVIRLRLDRLKIDRAQFIAELQTRGVGTTVHWLPLHMHPYYREKYGFLPGDFPQASALYPQIISLPLFPDMSEGDVGYVCDAIKDILGRHYRWSSRPAGRVVRPTLATPAPEEETEIATVKLTLKVPKQKPLPAEPAVERRLSPQHLPSVESERS
jgi:dTDP-4-amino-4,6-dideoxygalactose transaminase